LETLDSDTKTTALEETGTSDDDDDDFITNSAAFTA